MQSFYASIARGQDPDFDAYKGRVLILDEVDALVVDEEPNDIFVDLHCKKHSIEQWQI